MPASMNTQEEIWKLLCFEAQQVPRRKQTTMQGTYVDHFEGCLSKQSLAECLTQPGTLHDLRKPCRGALCRSRRRAWSEPYEIPTVAPKPWTIRCRHFKLSAKLHVLLEQQGNGQLNLRATSFSYILFQLREHLCPAAVQAFEHVCTFLPAEHRPVFETLLSFPSATRWLPSTSQL